MPNKYSLVGINGNAFAIMAYVRGALIKEGLQDQVDTYLMSAQSSDYDYLLQVSDKYLEKANANA